MADLQFCCQSLSEIGQAYKNSTRALEVIICIKREWQNKAKPKKLKRPGSMMEDSASVSKRRATGETQVERPAFVEDDASGNEAWQFLSGDEMAAFDDIMMRSFSETTFANDYINTVPPSSLMPSKEG